MRLRVYQWLFGFVTDCARLKMVQKVPQMSTNQNSFLIAVAVVMALGGVGKSPLLVSIL